MKTNKRMTMLLYVNDWLSSMKIALMTGDEERGYLRLLLHAWGEEDCGLPDDDAVLQKLSLIPEKDWKRKSGAIVRSCFRVENGRLYNDRQLQALRVMESYSEKRSAAGKLGAAKRWQKEAQTDGSDNADVIGKNNAVAIAKPSQKHANHNHNHNRNQTVDDDGMAQAREVQAWLHRYVSELGLAWEPPDLDVCTRVIAALSGHELSELDAFLTACFDRRQKPRESYGWFVAIVQTQFAKSEVTH